MSEIIERFQDLNVYKKAFELQQEIFKFTKRFPKEEIYSLCEYLSTEEFEKLFNMCKEIGKMLGKMMKNPKNWCRRSDPN